MPKKVPRILVVDDEKYIRELLSEVLKDEGLLVDEAEDGEVAFEKLEKEEFDAVLLDLKMPRMDGITLLKKIHAHDIDTAVIVITGHGTIQDAVVSTKLGVYDFIEKPLDIDKLLLLIRNCLKERRLLTEIKILRGEEEKPVFLSRNMKRVKENIERISHTDSPVLIYGPPGSDRLVLARYIHKKSVRRGKPFEFLNLSLIPKGLINGVLFGLPGKDREGKFHIAHTGTLFLDNIETVPMDIQEKILMYLTEGMIPITDEFKEPVNVRIIAGTDENLSLLVDEKKFNSRLLLMLSVIKLEIPSLSLRKEDIPALFKQYLDLLCKRDNLPLKTIDNEVNKILKTYPWPGDVEELKIFANKVYILFSDKEQITAEDIKPIWETYCEASRDKFLKTKEFKPLKLAKKEFERKYIRQVLEACKWNIQEAAKLLGIERTYLYSKIKKYKIHR